MQGYTTLWRDHFGAARFVVAIFVVNLKIKNILSKDLSKVRKVYLKIKKIIEVSCGY